MASQRIEIVKELRALEQFCTFKAVRSGEEQERFLRDYLADVQDFPLEAIQKGCADWRKSGQTKFPTPGQLIPLIKAHIVQARVEVSAQPWRPLTEPEYRALSVEDKIRHCRLLASQSRAEATKAAIKQGWDRNVANAPPIYRQHMDIADAHEAEAKRLRQYVRPQHVAA
jgi:hypothetical protein